MADDIHEVVLADDILEALSSPSASDVWRALSPHGSMVTAAVAAQRAKEGGGGGASTDTQRAAYSGNPVSVPDAPGGQPKALTWDSLGSGEALLDLTDPELPEVITGGIYAVTAVAHATELLNAGATYQATLHLDYFGDDAVCETSGTNDLGPGGPALGLESMVSLACTYYIPAGGVISLTVLLSDGTADRDFNLREAMIQRLS